MLSYLTAVEQATEKNVVASPTTMIQLQSFLKLHVPESWILVLERHGLVTHFVRSYADEGLCRLAAQAIAERADSVSRFYAPRVLFWSGRVLSASRYVAGEGVNTLLHTATLEKFDADYGVAVRFAWEPDFTQELCRYGRSETLIGASLYTVKISWQQYCAGGDKYVVAVQEQVSSWANSWRHDEKRRHEEQMERLREAAKRKHRSDAKQGKASKVHLSESSNKKKSKASGGLADLGKLNTAYGGEIAVGSKIAFKLGGLIVAGVVRRHTGQGLLVEQTNKAMTTVPDKYLQDGLVRLSKNNSGVMLKVVADALVK